ITHCADGVRAIIELLSNGYDWAIINGRAVSGGETDIARLIRAMGPDIQDKPAACSRSGDKANAGGMRTSCGAEWTKDGVLQLHCGLHELLKADALPRRDNLGCAGEIIFEYHAPCSKARGRHG
ncbi:MAG: hypothetical protein Q7J84_05835, partial [Sulfuricaulis sp.]|nr:hypothetical protein [Sulfuricaulis sp.]